MFKAQVCLQECLVTLEENKKRTLYSFWFYPIEFSRELSYFAVCSSRCHFDFRNLDLYLVLKTRYFQENYRSGIQSAVTKTKDTIYSNCLLLDTVVIAYITTYKAGKVVVSWSVVLAGMMHIPCCSCINFQKLGLHIPLVTLRVIILSLHS